MITKEMRISEVLDLDDSLSRILINHGLNCHGCPGAEKETLEEAAKGHKTNLSVLLEDLNSFLKEGK